MKSAQVDTGRRSRARALGMRFVRKLIWMLIVLWGITVVSFFVIHLAPGTPTDMQVSLNPLAGDTVRERLNALYGLDRPLAVQYMDWLNRLVHLDFGHSLSSDGRPVIEKIAERLPLTVGMNVATLLLTLLIAVPVGVVSAARQGSLLDRSLTVLVFLGFAMPSFWLALLLMLYFSIDLGWLPLSGLTSLNFATLSDTGKILDVARHLVRRGRDFALSAFIHAGSIAPGLHFDRAGQRFARTYRHFSSCLAQRAFAGHHSARPVRARPHRRQRHH